MKKILFILPIFITGFCFGQRGYQFVENGSSLDSYQKYIKDTVCADCVYDNKNGNIPTIYQWVEYNYGEPPPEYIEIVKSFLTKGMTDTIRGWAVSYENVLSIGGDGAVYIYDITQTCLNKINSKLPVYKERLAVVYPSGQGEDDEFKISIFTPKEETDRRIKEIEKSGLSCGSY